MLGFWMENGMARNHARHTIVDLGPTAQARENFELLRPHISARNFERVGNDRMVARIPPRKVAAVLAAVPKIQAGEGGYCWCTHHMPYNAQGERRP